MQAKHVNTSGTPVGGFFPNLQKLKILPKFLFFALLLGILLAPTWRIVVRYRYQKDIFSVATAKNNPVAIVFGAAIYRNGSLSGILRDRMNVAIALYKQGQVQKIIVSGDNRFDDYNEPAAMMSYAVRNGVPAADIQPDYGGRRTYDTCYRAKYIFQIDRAIVISQRFHLPRILFTCRQLGLDAVGVQADLRRYFDAPWYEIRETAATVVALLDIIRREPPPVMGEPIPIT